MHIETTLRRYIFLLESFKSKKMLDAYDSELLDRTGLSSKQLGRLLDEISQELDCIVKFKEGKRFVYKLIKPIDLFIETYKSFGSIGWFFTMAKDADIEIFDELPKYINKNNEVYRFINSPFEDLNSFEAKDIFAKLEVAVRNREYRKIRFKQSQETYDNLKCLKLLFVDNNWYLVFVDNHNSLRLGRVSFIESVEYASNHSRFQQQSVQEHLEFIDKIQNSMTLFGRATKQAIIRAKPVVARYFDDGMKKFLASQQFIRKNDDGSVVFSLGYTQPIEILPFIQRWLPNLEIIEPMELREELREVLKSAIEQM